MGSSPNHVQVLDSEPGRFLFLAWHNITVAVWTAPPDTAVVKRLAHVGRARTKEHRILSDVHLVTGRIGLPDAATRAALIAESKQAVPHLAAVAVVVGGAGFWASAFRGFVTGVHVLVHGKYDLRLFQHAEEAAAWLPKVHEAKTGISVDPTDLASVLQQALATAAPSPELSQAAARIEDLMDYKRKDDDAREAVLDRLVDDAQEQDLGYRKP